MKKLIVLVVEDESVSALALQRYFMKCGYEVYGPASSGEEALDLARKYLPDVILMDISLIGEMNGVMAMRAIRAFSQCPVIYLSGYNDESLRESALQYQPAVFMNKPVLSSMVEKEVKRLLQP